MMRFLCVGLGAIGTYIGGSLLKAGHEVVFLVRKKTDDLPGVLTIREGEDITQIGKPQLISDLASVRQLTDFDYAILAVKSYDTEGVIQQIIPKKEVFPHLLCFQNGIENEEKFVSVLGSEQVVPCTITTAVSKKGPGNIVVERKRGIGVGDHAGGIALTQTLNGANLDARLYRHVTAMKWSKLLTNLLANASSAILGWSPDLIFRHRGLYSLEVEQLREALSVMEAISVDVINLPGAPVIPLVKLMKLLPKRLSHPLIARALGRGRGTKMPSLFIDLDSGREKSEVTALNGVIFRKGAELGIDTPVNRTYEKVLLSIMADPSLRKAFRGNPSRLMEAVEMGYYQG